MYKSLCALLCVYVINVVPASDVQTKIFYKLASPNKGMISVGDYKTSSVSACCNRCVTRHDSNYVIYNKDLTSCTCGSSLSEDIPAPTGSDLLYVSHTASKYHNYAGFSIFEQNGTSVCLYISSQNLTYSNAAIACSQFTNGRLFVADTLVKLDILTQLTKDLGLFDELIYVGLDDRVSEDVFVWSDGRTMSSSERENLFREDQPDDSYGEDCVHFLYQGELNDIGCETQALYLCEIPLTN